MLPKAHPEIVLKPLYTQDITQMETLERAAGLSFWGKESYSKILEELKDYYGCKLLVCLPNGQSVMAGFLLVRFVPDAVEILKVAVLAEYRRRGFASLLLDQAFAEGRKRGCLRCYLEVRTSNQTAIRFYLDRGFRLAGRRPHYYSDPVEDALVMDRDLP